MTEPRLDGSLIAMELTSCEGDQPQEGQRDESASSDSRTRPHDTQVVQPHKRNPPRPSRIPAMVLSTPG